MMERIPSGRISTESLERRQRIQKLRWLGFDYEADRLARAEPRAETQDKTVALPVTCPETD